MSAGGTIGSVLVCAALVALIVFIVRGGSLGLPSTGGGRIRGRRSAGGRSPFEVFFAIFAVANLAVSPSAGTLGAPLVIAAMVLLVVAYALFPDLGFLIVVVGAVAAVADIALAESPAVAIAVFVVAALLAWIFGAARMFSRAR